MRYVRFYMAGSVLIGVTMVSEAISLLLLGPLLLLNQIVAAAEYIWLFLSIAAIIVFIREEVSIKVPLSFVLYTVLSIAYGMYMLFTGADLYREISPVSVALYGAFALFFTVVSFLGLRHLGVGA